MKMQEHRTESEWMTARLGGVGASEVPRLVLDGSHKLWHTKVNGYEEKRHSDQLAEFGHRSEEMNARWFVDVTGKQLSDPGDYTMFWHERLPMFATIDRFVVVDGEPVAVCETKAAFGDLGRLVENVTAHDLRHSKLERYYWQVQAQMSCTGLSEGFFSILYFTGFGAGHRWFRCDRDDRVIRAIEKRVAEFWKCVETKTPPDWRSATAADVEAIARMREPSPGRVLPLESPDDLSWFSECEKLGSERSEVNKAYDDFKAKALARMSFERVDRIVCGTKCITAKPFAIRDWKGE